MKICTVANEYTQHLPELIASCDGKLDLKVTLKAGYWNWGVWLDWQMETCKRYPDEMLVFMDAYDTLFVGDPDELEELVDYTFFHGFLHATCKECWPIADRAKHYPKSSTPWKYLNACGPAGYSDQILEALRHGMAYYPYPHPALPYDNDQRFWTDVFLDGYGALDNQCELWQDLHLIEEDEVAIKGGRICNLVTGSKPQFLHASAGSWHYIPEQVVADAVS